MLDGMLYGLRGLNSNSLLLAAGMNVINNSLLFCMPCSSARWVVDYTKIMTALSM